MSQKRIKNQFQKVLGDYASKVDEDQLWSDIEGRVPKKNKKRRFFIWFIFGLPLLAVLVASFWLIPEKPIDSGGIALNNSKLDKKEQTENNQNSTLSKGEVENNIEDNKSAVLNTLIKDIYKQSELSNSSVNYHSNDSKTGGPTNEDLITYLFSLKNKSEKYPTSRSKLMGIKVLEIPKVNYLTSTSSESFVKSPKLKKKKPRRVKPAKKIRSSLGLKYFAGTSFLNRTLSSQDERYVDYGEANFSQGISFSYDRYIASRFYGKIMISMDRTHMKYSDKISRDTLVPSSLGKQILTYSQYSNGVIDTESGIPLVRGVFTRDVVNLNTITSVSIGLGIGYTQRIGKFNLNIEGDLQRSIYYDLSGLGREETVNRIEDLNEFQDYFSTSPKYTVNAQISTDFQLVNSVLVTCGFQYQMGQSSMVLNQTGHTEKINLLRLSVGLKKLL